jgi:hypothetical protein
MKNFLWSAFGILVGIVAISTFVFTFVYAVQSEQKGGTFGDTFGVATSFFSMLTLGFLVIAVVLQRKEFGLVREERDDTKRLLEGQEKINSMQEAALKKQSFEQSFFSLLSLIVEEKRTLDKSVGTAINYSWKYQARDSAKSGLKHVFGNKIASQESINNYVADCGTVCRLLTTAHNLILEFSYSEKRDTVTYASALNALMDAEIAHVWCYLSIIWEETDPRSAKAFIDCQGLAFLDRQFKHQAEERLKVALANFDAIQNRLFEKAEESA